MSPLLTISLPPCLCLKNWQDYKLPFPWSAAVKQRDKESSRQLQGPLAGFPSNSLNGPLMDAGLVAVQVEEDARRGPLLQVKGGLDVSLLDEAADIDAAAGVSQCKVWCAAALLAQAGTWVSFVTAVPASRALALSAAAASGTKVKIETAACCIWAWCISQIHAVVGFAATQVCGVLVRRLWEGLTRWVDARQQVPSKHRITDFALELCEVEVGGCGMLDSGRCGISGCAGQFVCLLHGWACWPCCWRSARGCESNKHLPEHRFVSTPHSHAETILTSRRGSPCLKGCPACPLPLPLPLQVPIEVLEGWVLHRARLEQGEGLPFTVEGQTQEFYMLR